MRQSSHLHASVYVCEGGEFQRIGAPRIDGSGLESVSSSYSLVGGIQAGRSTLHTSGIFREFVSMRRYWALFAVAASICSGCAKPHFDGVEYRDREVAFRLGPLPAGMRELSSSESKIAGQNDAAGATLAIGARCRLDSDDVPLPALVQHLFLQLTARKTISEKEFTLDGRAALELEMDASLDGVQRHFLVVVLKKDGCVYDFLHIDRGGSGPGLTQSRDDFRSMVRGFRTLN